MEKKTLIIVDMLNDFVHEKGALYCGTDAKKIIPFIAKRLVRYREEQGQIIFLQDAHDKNDLEFEKFPKHAVAGTWGSQIITELTPLTGELVINKKRYSGFFGTDLAKLLADVNPKKVEVTGVCTSICVMDTVGGLANRDYSVVVPSQGVADFDPEFHNFALKRMAQLYGAEVQ
ncbi:MAG: isochorismatase family cysteine hydrolase [Desulfobacteraceae bacterium]|jgi:nicotinamidase-related amidase